MPRSAGRGQVDVVVARRAGDDQLQMGQAAMTAAVTRPNWSRMSQDLGVVGGGDQLALAAQRPIDLELEPLPARRAGADGRAILKDEIDKGGFSCVLGQLHRARLVIERVAAMAMTRAARAAWPSTAGSRPARARRQKS